MPPGKISLARTYFSWSRGVFPTFLPVFILSLGSIWFTRIHTKQMARVHEDRNQDIEKRLVNTLGNHLNLLEQKENLVSR